MAAWVLQGRCVWDQADKPFGKDKHEMIFDAAQDAQTVETSEEATACCQGSVAEPLAGTETILFVEDEAFVREVAGEVLRSAGYQVLTANDAAAAARAYDLQCGDVDLLLSDVVLPGESGHALVRKLRRTSPALKVLLITGYAEQMAAPETGVCLGKPFSGAVLLRRVRQALDGGGVPDGGRKSGSGSV